MKFFAESKDLVYYNDVSKIGDGHTVRKYTKYFNSRPDSVTVLATENFSNIVFVATDTKPEDSGELNLSNSQEDSKIPTHKIPTYNIPTHKIPTWSMA